MLNWIYRVARWQDSSVQQETDENQARVVSNEQPGVWRVEYKATFWYAYASKRSKQCCFQPDDVVQVVGLNGINLLIDKAE
jgi:membrane protein implicated in regulation of membrane protease activity